MQVSAKAFNVVAISLGAVAFALLPIWPYSRWGYTPVTLVIVVIAMLFMFRSLARG